MSTWQMPSRVSSSISTTCRRRARNGWSDRELSAAKYCKVMALGRKGYGHAKYLCLPSSTDRPMGRELVVEFPADATLQCM